MLNCIWCKIGWLWVKSNCQNSTNIFCSIALICKASSRGSAPISHIVASWKFSPLQHHPLVYGLLFWGNQKRILVYRLFHFRWDHYLKKMNIMLRSRKPETSKTHKENVDWVWSFFSYAYIHSDLFSQPVDCRPLKFNSVAWYHLCLMLAARSNIRC